MELVKKEKEIIAGEELMKPLVSVIIVTYNSAHFVLETLESAKAQTYSNIELIITDDFSSDGTIAICTEWLEKNGARFVSTSLIASKKNTGIPGNCNRGLFKAEGEWVKLIAGDDILLDNCIADLVDYCLLHPPCKVLFGRTYFLYNDYMTPKPLEKIALADAGKQRDIVYQGRPGPDLPAPSSFFNRNTLKQLGGFDTEYVLLEDLPLWAKLVDNNIRLYFLEKFVTKYRIHTDNVSGNRSKTYINVKLHNDIKRYAETVLFPYFRKNGQGLRLLHFYNYFIITQLILFLGNKTNIFSKAISYLVIWRTVDTIKKKIRELSERKIKNEHRINNL